MQIEKKPIGELNPAAYNPRVDLQPGDAEYERIKKSILEFDYVDPIIWNAQTENVVGGHQRLKILKELGYSEVEVPVVDLPLEKEKALNVALNKNQGRWDFAKLVILLQELDAGQFDMETLGFDLDEVNELLSPAEKSNHESPIIENIISLEDLAPNDEELRMLNGRKIFIEFSGGKDSTVATLWIKQFLPDADCELLFVEMGADYPGFAVHLHDISEMIGYPLIVLRSATSMIEQFLKKREWPHFAMPYCHQLLHDTLDEYVRSYSSDDIVVIRGGRLQERASRQGRKNQTRFMMVDRMKGYLYFQPLYFADKDSLTDILPEGLLWSGYRYGLQRTACRVCPGQRMVAYAAIKMNFPDVWDELVWLEKRLGPGCWSDPIHNRGRGSFTELAERGMNDFEEGQFLRR
jgi:3'-phosphoadenosine 5'-phosphosulfate sulfotransferase (PAPS reductase)/FAD synthetase